MALSAGCHTHGEETHQGKSLGLLIGVMKVTAAAPAGLHSQGALRCGWAGSAKQHPGVGTCRVPHVSMVQKLPCIPQHVLRARF